MDNWDKRVPVEESPYNWESTPVVLKRCNEYRRLTVVDLFCGAGGASLGFDMAGFDVILGIDNHEPSLATFLKNHSKANGILGDIRKVTKENVFSCIGGKDVNCIIAGVPCQGFSLNNRKRNPDDPRNYLFWEFIRFVKMLTPDVLVLENVPGMKAAKNGKVFEEIAKQIRLAGLENRKNYKVSHGILNAADFGVPQIRRRLVFIAVAERYEPIIFPKIVLGQFGKPYRTIMDAIGDLPNLNPGEEKTEYGNDADSEYQKIMRGRSSIILNHKAPKHPPNTVKKIGSTKPGYPIYPRFKQRIRLSWDNPSPTLVAGGIRPQYLFGHPRDPRGLSIRERARIQSFPDNYEFLGGVVQGRVQTGNAVPPLMARGIAEQVKAVLNNERNTDSEIPRVAYEVALFE